MRLNPYLDGFWWKGRYFPLIAGAEGEGSGEGSGNAGDGDTGSQGNGEGGNGSGEGDDAGNDGAQNTSRNLQRALEQERAERRKLQKKIDEQDKKDREAAEAAAAQKGEFEKLYNTLKASSESRIAELEGELFRRDAERALVAYLGEKHPSYAARARWLLPVLLQTVKPDMDEAAVQKVVKDTADAYVKDHPLNTEGGGAPGGGNRSGNQRSSDPLAKFPDVKSIIDRVAPAPVSGAGGS